mgnify:CR=1 FL=1
MDILQKLEHLFTNVISVLSPIIIAWLGYKLPKKSKEQTEQIISEVSDVKKQIEDVQITPAKSNVKISEIQEKQKLNEEEHKEIIRTVP